MDLKIYPEVDFCQVFPLSTCSGKNLFAWTGMAKGIIKGSPEEVGDMALDCAMESTSIWTGLGDSVEVFQAERGKGLGWLGNA